MTRSVMMMIDLDLQKCENMKNLYYSDLNAEEKQLFKYYCVLKNISSFKLQNYFSGNYPLDDEYINFLDVYNSWKRRKNDSKI